MNSLFYAVIATGKYTRFVKPLWESAAKHLLPAQKVYFALFTDESAASQVKLPPRITTQVFRVNHGPWPHSTRERYSFFLSHEPYLHAFSHFLYTDADMLFDAPIGDEIFAPGTLAVKHPGFNGQPRAAFTYEGNPKSRAYVRPDEGEHYFCGGVQGGEMKAWIKACRKMRDGIEADKAVGIEAAWNDESYWNRYCIDVPPSRILSPLYCSPDSWNVPDRKIVAISKSHAELRS